jgi:hypothetical protein
VIVQWTDGVTSVYPKIPWDPRPMPSGVHRSAEVPMSWSRKYFYLGRVASHPHFV